MSIDLRERIDRIFAESARRKALEQSVTPFPRRLHNRCWYTAVTRNWRRENPR